ncbi:MAG: MBL fold metallo-hydrolase [Desulfomonile tiedjei]|nr:MBL fold metallo-hydrolase [Desulfomonile tiedjei]
MLDDRITIVNPGDEYRNGMIVKISVSTGRDIFALATKNVYSGDWDVGPTWNYLIASDRPFLVDAGRRGMASSLMEMMEFVGIPANKLDSVVLSHGHEDHDGGLFALTQAAGVEIKAHETYQTLAAVAPSQAPLPEVSNYPASCWRCPMPNSFTQKNCHDYHRERETLNVTPICDENYDLGQGISVLHVPGHSPDCLAFVIDDEVMLTGDMILPEITPHPTREQHFEAAQRVLPSRYDEAAQLYGLRAYIRSVKRLREVSRRVPGLVGLPAHRLFSNGRCNVLTLSVRCDELIQHHIQRCSDILGLVGSQPMTPVEIAHGHFQPQLLNGFGINLALDEVLSHCEILEHSGDITWVDGKVVSTGKRGFETFINDIH